jgi:hypothetical protein
MKLSDYLREVSMFERLENRVFLAGDAVQLPVITVNAPAKSASENGPTARPFTLVRSGDTSTALRVSYLIGGKAKNGIDYEFIKSWANIGEGKSTVRVWVTPIDDTEPEPTEAVTLTLSPRGTYQLGETFANTIRIADNDGAVADQRTQIAWSTVAPSPIWRCESQKGVVDGKLYVLGGFIDGMTGPVVRSDVYDPAANKWTQIADLPTRLTHAATAVDGTKIYLVGGWVGWGVLGQQDYGTTDVWIYDTATDSYSKGPSLPQPRGAGAMVKLDRTLHFMSGTDPQRNDRTEHWVLNLDRQEDGWQLSVAMPVGRNHAAAIVVDGHIFYIGGQVGPDDITGAKSEFYVWHPLWSAWKQLPDLPIARSHHTEATMLHQGRIITIAGISNGIPAMKQVSAYDPSKGLWTELTPLPAGRYTGVAAIIDDVIYYSTGAATTTYKGVFL